MGRDLRFLARRLIETANRIDDFGNDVSKKVAVAIITDLAFNTPVDTSRAISNWQVTIGSANATRIDPIYLGIAGSTKAASASEVIAKALRILETKKPGETIFVQNKLPYIRRLNDGSSSQAPAGFVERAELIGRKVAELQRSK